RAVRPDDRVSFAGWHGETDAANDFRRAEILVHVDELDRGRGHFIFSAACAYTTALCQAMPTTGQVRRNRKNPPASRTTAAIHDIALVVSSVRRKREIVAPSDALTVRW